MTSIADPTNRYPVLYIGRTAPANAQTLDVWLRTTDDPTTEAWEYYERTDADTWVNASVLPLGTGAAPP
jgi:hypothetical protein